MEKHTEQSRHANAGRRGETKEYKESVYHVLWACGCMAAMCECQRAFLLPSLLSNYLQDRNTLQHWGSILTAAHTHIRASRVCPERISS